MIELEFTAGRISRVNDGDRIRVLRDDNTRESIAASELVPGMLVVGVGIIVRKRDGSGAEAVLERQRAA
jgi:hypothetical protein